MKAAFYEGNRTVSVGECQPQAPGPGEVQVRVSHCGVCGTDLHIFHGSMDARVRIPQVLGHEMSGEIAAIGEGVPDYKIGDRVVVRPLDPCGTCPACQAGHSHICQNLKFLGIDTPGAFQSLWTVPAHTLHRMPDQLSLQFGALIEPLAVACHDVRLGQVLPGESAVVLGGGPIGMLVALVARHRGAHLVLSEINPFRIEFAEGLGFEVVNPLETNLPEYIEEKTGGAGADIVFEVSGAAPNAELMTQLVRTRGRIVVVAIHPEPRPVDLFRFFWRELRLCGVRVYEPEDYEAALSLAAEGALPLEKLVSEVRPLEGLQQTFEEMSERANIMKVLIDCNS